MEGADAYLPLAEQAGLGVFEHGDPRFNGGYSKIDFVRIDQKGSGDSISGIVKAKGGAVAGAKVVAKRQGGVHLPVPLFTPQSDDMKGDPPCDGFRKAFLKALGRDVVKARQGVRQ